MTVFGEYNTADGLLLRIFLGGGSVVAVEVTVPHPTPSVPDE